MMNINSRNYNYGNYGMLAKPRTVGNLRDGFDFGNIVKTVVDIGGEYVDDLAETIGIPTDNEYYQLGKEVGKSAAVDAINNAKTEAELTKTKNDARIKAESVLSRYAGLNCSAMTDAEKQGIAAALAEHSAIFAGLGMSNELAAVIKKYEIPTDCAVTSSTVSKEDKKVFVPVAIGAGTATVGWFALGSVLQSTTVRLLSSLAAGSLAGYGSYRAFNKDIFEKSEVA